MIPLGLWGWGSVAIERSCTAGTSTCTQGLLQGHWVRGTLHTMVGACLVFGGRQLQGLVQACVTTAAHQKWSERL